MAFHAVEKLSFPYTHVQAIAVLALEYGLPELIGEPLARHHQRTELQAESSDVDRLSAISYFVGGLRFASDLAVYAEERDLREYGRRALGLNDDAWALAQGRATDTYLGLALLYGNMLPEDVNVLGLLSEANRQLTAVASEVDCNAFDVAAEREQARRQQERLAEALREYRERAALDPLTNILNRGGLIDGTRRALKQHREHGAPVGVLFADLDNFKQINDVYGHGVGDRVLKSVAILLGEHVPDKSIVGRYGGEEFVVVVQNASVEATRRLAERVLQGVRALRIETPRGTVRVTCSIGATWGDDIPVQSAEDLFHAADVRMYRAKRTGKDRCCFEVLTGGGHGPHGEGDAAGGSDRGGVPTRNGTDEQSDMELLDRLRALAERRNREEQDPAAGIRKLPRTKLVTLCILHHHVSEGASKRAEPACLRNISPGGAGLLIARPMARGESVEVELNLGGVNHVVPSLIAYCRHIEGSIHELGIQFMNPGIARETT
jgi:diguanylate cyclase (GGDEF)-like protein